jgi:hypothetical protein
VKIGWHDGITQRTIVILPESGPESDAGFSLKPFDVGSEEGSEGVHLVRHHTNQQITNKTAT